MRRPPALSVEPLEDRIEPSGGITVLPQPPDTRDWAAAYTRLVPDLPYGTTGTTTLTPTRRPASPGSPTRSTP